MHHGHGRRVHGRFTTNTASEAYQRQLTAPVKRWRKAWVTPKGLPEGNNYKVCKWIRVDEVANGDDGTPVPDEDEDEDEEDGDEEDGDGGEGDGDEGDGGDDDEGEGEGEGEGENDVEAEGDGDIDIDEEPDTAARTVVIETHTADDAILQPSDTTPAIAKEVLINSASAEPIPAATATESVPAAEPTPAGAKESPAQESGHAIVVDVDVAEKPAEKASSEQPMVKSVTENLMEKIVSTPVVQGEERQVQSNAVEVRNAAPGVEGGLGDLGAEVVEITPVQTEPVVEAAPVAEPTVEVVAAEKQEASVKAEGHSKEGGDAMDVDHVTGGESREKGFKEVVDHDKGLVHGEMEPPAGVAAMVVDGEDKAEPKQIE